MAARCSLCSALIPQIGLRNQAFTAKLKDLERSVMLALMSVPGTPPIRFGVFELHIRSGELRRKGSKVNLQDQPFQALVLLLEHPGELVTRDELRKNLWPQNTFVDFERGLNKAINK